MEHKLEGGISNFGEVTVFLDGAYLSPKRSQKVYNHSPDGFNFGYCGSGPAQLALAVCLECLGTRDKALAKYQQFKREVIAGLPQGKSFSIKFTMGGEDGS